MAGLRLGLLAALLLSLRTLLHCALAQQAMDRGMDRFGWDMAGSPFSSPSSTACQSACKQHPACVSWAYTRSQCDNSQRTKHSAAPGCRLKFALAGTQLDNCSDSGWIPERMKPRCADQQYQRWPASEETLARLVGPIPRSTSLLPAVLASNCTVTYARADTWYCAWAEDDSLRCLYEDGAVNGVVVNGHETGQPATAGVVTVTGQHPFQLRLHNASRLSAAHPGYDGRFISANAYQQGVWYVASAPRNDYSAEVPDCGGHCLMGPLGRFQLSYDGGQSFTAASSSPLVTDNLWLQDSGHRLSRRVKYGEMHVVDLGREGHRGGVEDGYTYLVGHGSQPDSVSRLLWNQADAVFLARVKLSPDSVNEPTAWQFWAGDALQWLRWAELGIARAAPLLVWPNRTGSVSVTFVPALRRYVMLYAAPHTANTPLGGSDLLLLESRAMTGPYRLVDQWDNFGPTAYFPTLPSKFISSEAVQVATTAGEEKAAAELQLWLCFSTLNTYQGLGDPLYTAYAWNMLSIKLRLSQPAYDELLQQDSRVSAVAAFALLMSCGAIVVVLWQRPATRIAVCNLMERMWKLRRTHRYEPLMT